MFAVPIKRSKPAYVKSIHFSPFKEKSLIKSQSVNLYNDPDIKVLRVLLEKEDQQNKDDQEREITEFNQC